MQNKNMQRKIKQKMNEIKGQARDVWYEIRQESDGKIGRFYIVKNSIFIKKIVSIEFTSLRTVKRWL